MRARIVLPILLIVVSLGMLVCACGSNKGIRGEIIGIEARVPLAEAQSGQFKSGAYTGNLVVLLPDGEKITAKYSKDLLSDIKGCPKFNTDQLKGGGFVATITIQLKEHQEVLLVRNQSDQWEVSKVIK